jgi:anti-sigma factor RsiW
MIHGGELLSAYLDGELSADEEIRIVDHLERCGACRVDLADLQSARAAVRGLPVIEAPPWLRPADATASDIARRHPAATVAAAAVAILVVIIGIAAWLSTPPAVELDLSDIAVTHGVKAVQEGTPVGGGIGNIVTVVTSRGVE